MSTTPRRAPADLSAPPEELLQAVERRVLWLATSIVHHANKVRENTSGVKVGGHQASSASMVSIMTALWFAHLRAPDRVSVKPHASPVLHAINYLLGELDPKYLTTLRELGGLQSYPSRTKDPDPVDFSTGSVGIGATATIWSALAHRYVAGHTDVPVGGRQIALLGDAELDEGAIWEALVDPVVPSLGEVMWVVDLNRQSLDRVVPAMAIQRLQGMFAAAGWQVLTVKYGRRLEELFAAPGGEAVRARIDRMPNEEYQRMLRAPAAEVRERLLAGRTGKRDIAKAIKEYDDDRLHRTVRNLGGHDHAALLDAYRAADQATDQPSVVFAYTVKGWSLPTEGHPSNHSALLSAKEYDALAPTLGADTQDPWAAFDPDSDEGQLCAETARTLHRAKRPPAAGVGVPEALDRAHVGETSTQQALGRLLTDLAHAAPDTAKRIVTVSPDVASSTNLGGWINRVGIWSVGERIDWFADDRQTLVKWREHQHGQHMELGIAEVNLVGLLSELGATWSRDGAALLPIGTIYDPFVARALEPWSFGMYAGGQSILIGTPSGVTLAPEGGAHQSINTPSIGIEQPECIAWEPAFGQDLEWTFLHALSRLGQTGGTSSYFRLTTRPIDQALSPLPTDAEALAQRRADVLAGGYRLADGGPGAQVTLVGVGAVMPEVLEAARIIEQDTGYAPHVVCLTSPDLVFRATQARRGLTEGPSDILARLFPEDRLTPIVTVMDGHPHTLSFLGVTGRIPITNVGVERFGQAGSLEDVYAHHGLDPESIVGAALDLVT
ncbi:Pyruvate dehydrogenase E1 component [Paraconexibacter sp. AEG42_29]|uniref:Pyruvate dehydrogenase E1 component n=1 Tax=Paraconexibacter sp. AEG42_29 TaxID=2997339 RepID=A0AAU7AYI3_9ACTN